MSDLFWRSFADADIQVRSDGRTIYGLFVPWDSPTEIRSEGEPYVEAFQRGAFTRSIKSAEQGRKIPGFVEHGHRLGRLPVGIAQNMRDDASGLVGEIKVSETRDGDEAIALARDGALGSFSVGFAPVKGKDVWSGRNVLRTEAFLGEVSLVTFPAYSGAVVGGVRHALDIGTSITPDGDSNELDEQSTSDSSNDSEFDQMAMRARIAEIEHRRTIR